MRAMHQENTIKLKPRKAILLGTSALVCLALAAPVMATDFTIASQVTATNNNYTIDGGDTVNVTGTIDTGTTNSESGINTTGSNNINVSTGGIINTGGTGSDGIWNEGNTNTTTMSGSITTTGTNAYGIHNESSSNTTTVSGSITTTNTNAYGIVNYGNTNKTTVSGSITTGGTNADGIRNIGASNTTTVSGRITAGNGIDAYGIHNEGNTNTTTVSGRIETTGQRGEAIRNWGSNNETTMSGSITTTNTNAYGIHNRGNTNKTTVSGSITTGGAGAHAIAIQGDDNTTTVSGSITATGGSGGIAHNGDDNTTTISGTVKATSASSAALLNFKGSGNSFTLNTGATIIGDILAMNDTVSDPTNIATNSELIFSLGASTSYAYTVSGKGEGTTGGKWTFSDLDGRTQGITTDGTGCTTTVPNAGNTVCNLVTAVGNGNAEAQDELQFGMNTSMIGSLKRHAKPATAAATFALSTDTTPDTLDEGKYSTPQKSMPSTQVLKRNVWANVYGGTSERSSTTTQSSFDSSNRGLTIGTPVAINDTLNVDLVFNTSRTSLDIGLTKDQEITANSYNVGAVLRDLAPASGWGVDAYGFVGRNSYDGKRKVMNNQETTGSESVTASYSGTEVLVGVDAQYSQAIDETLNFTSGVNASLSNEKIGAYSESKYYSWDARTLTQVAGGVTAGLEYHKDAFTSFASLGLQRSSLQKGKTAGYTNNGTAGSYTDTSSAATYRTATVGFSYAADDSMNITGTAGMSRASGGIKGSSLSLSANWEF